jgi:hypothetical protein
LVVWFGALTEHAGLRRATVIGHDAADVRSIVGREDEYVPTAGAIGAYVFEPDAAVLAAHLHGALAAEHALQAVAAGVAYWTGDRPLHDPALAAFAMQEVLPFDARRVKALLRERKIGRLEVKQRGTGLEPATIQRQLRVEGNGTATLLLAKIQGHVVAILAQRVLTHSPSGRGPG